MIRRRTSVPNPVGPHFLVRVVPGLFRIRGRAVPHAVKPGEVGTRLAGADHIIGGKRVLHGRDAAGNGSCAELFEITDGGFYHGRDGRVDPGAKIFLRDADFQSPDICFGRVGIGFAVGSRVVPVVACDDLHQGRNIADGLSHGADLFERVRVRDQAVARDPAVTWFQADDTAERCRAADRATCIGAERHLHHAARDRRRAPAAGTPRDAPGVAGIEGGTCTPSSRLLSPSRTRPYWSCRESRLRNASGVQQHGRHRAGHTP